jgi:hypothetical protein
MVRGTADDRRRRPVDSRRKESSMRTPISAYRFTAGCTFSISALFSGVLGRASSALWRM